MAGIGPVGNHLWQTTVFSGVVALLALALRANRAQVRHWLWFGASVKCLIPLAGLVMIGSQFGWPSSAAIRERELTLVMDAVSQPFSRSELTVAAVALQATPSLTVTARAPAIGAVLPPLLGAIWLCGCAVIFLTWWVRWRRVTAVVRQASAFEHGRELDILRRLERSGGIKKPTALVSSNRSSEPGVFGILNPVLLWPRGMTECLEAAQMEAILAHELCHVRRRDNLVAAVHMLVQAVFWFHPLVWWVGRRLVDERERACDEDVIRSGNDPRVYAEGILKTCQFSVESPLVCVAGVTGSDLEKRIEAIMVEPFGFPSIFTALREQLGLRLDAQSGPVDVLAIDHAEKPAEG